MKNEQQDTGMEDKKSLTDKIGNIVEKVGHKVADLGAEKLGQKIHDLGDKLEKTHQNPDHPHKA